MSRESFDEKSQDLIREIGHRLRDMVTYDVTNLFVRVKSEHERRQKKTRDQEIEVGLRDPITGQLVSLESVEGQRQMVGNRTKLRTLRNNERVAKALLTIFPKKID